MTATLVLSLIRLLLLPPPALETVRLDQLDLAPMRQSFGRPVVDRAIRGGPLVVAGREFAHGVGTHARSRLWLELDGACERFLASAGVDDAAGGAASVSFRVIADGRTLFDSGVMQPGFAAREIDVPLRGARLLLLAVDDARDGIGFDHADWGEARFLYSGAAPRPVAQPQEEAVLLTPLPPPAPRLNGPRLRGCRPGRPFLYRIKATGTRPITFSAENLPAGIVLDETTGILTGVIAERGATVVRLRAVNAAGAAERDFTIVCGDRLALTPPMGWNHWYAHYDRITGALVRKAAERLISSGLADAGYDVVGIDDGWANTAASDDPLRVGPARDAEGRILQNRHFPDMRALTDFIHARGLAAGIYTSPGPTTCAGYAGSFGHEAADAARFAEWGFDFLKYDWCSYDATGEDAGAHALEALKRPYRYMGTLVAEQPRDIVFNICQYGMGDVWEWGAGVGGHCWRTAGDLGHELDRFFDVALANCAHARFSGPGAWNDPDYLQIGWIGRSLDGGAPGPCGLTPNEQYAFMSLWCLMAAPLFYSGDLSRLDAFTLNVLANPELIDIDQDPLGLCGRVIELEGDAFALAKPLEDGSLAVGLFNRDEVPATVAVTWPELGLEGPRLARDPWRQIELGVVDERFEAVVPRHGVAMLRLRAAPR